MITPEPHDTSSDNALSLAVIKLLKGVVYQDDDPGLWQQIMTLQPRIRDYVALLGLTFQLDEAEGYAWLVTRESDADETPLPRLMSRRQLSYPVSLLIALLRRKLAEADASGGDVRVILDREEVVSLMRTFLPESSNEARLVDQIDSHLNKVADLGFIRRLRDQPDKIEIRRILKAYVDAQWLNAFDLRLADYRQHITPHNDQPATREGQQ
ncbi:DUF4194 domain-containing protein [Vreelandella subglaciescola]|jgi:hypothetical protein|uniref:DUF4194 domain-containing protein n=1 Tax=Vreelandella subglaciescola TaxID=29571 RepID=A0A1M7GAW0_9GAMM|nr:DUF4194 domain-containing protein [Halomonas subglaciescola]SHM13522.1 protein of unknown function [Halomonas subglaciescola]